MMLSVLQRDAALTCPVSILTTEHALYDGACLCEHDAFATVAVIHLIANVDTVIRIMFQANTSK